MLDNMPQELFKGFMVEQEIVPPPWDLQGRGYIFILDLSQEELGSLVTQEVDFFSFAMVMLVDYRQSPVGPYYELLFIPGRLKTKRGCYWHISQIYVSSTASALSGRANWGIPKEVADFSCEFSPTGAKVTVTKAGQLIATLSLQHKSFTIPVTTKLVWEPWRSFYQQLERTEFIFAPQAQGRLGLAEVQSWESQLPYFPTLTAQKIKLALFVEHFHMTFPHCLSLRSL